MRIASPVGPNRPNRSIDVETVQRMLNRARGQMPGQPMLKVDRLFGPRTGAAILRYQSQVMGFGRPDGVVDPFGPTLRRLSGQAGGGRPAAAAPVAPLRQVPAPRAAPAPAHMATPVTGGGGSRSLTEEQYADIAAKLDCEVAAVKAVVQTEVEIRGAFDAQGRPTILYERHLFHRHTNGRFSAAHPDISNATSGGYGRFSEQYPKLERAMQLDRDAGLKSASWGAFQILGENYAQAGHPTLDSFIAAMRHSIQAQANAFVAFVKADRRLLSAIRERNWATFARIYNGPGYRKNRYDEKMRAYYQRYSNGG